MIQEGGDHLPKSSKAQRRLRKYNRLTPVFSHRAPEMPSQGFVDTVPRFGKMASQNLSLTVCPLGCVVADWFCVPRPLLTSVMRRHDHASGFLI